MSGNISLTLEQVRALLIEVKHEWNITPEGRKSGVFIEYAPRLGYENLICYLVLDWSLNKCLELYK